MSTITSEDAPRRRRMKKYRCLLCNRWVFGEPLFFKRDEKWVISGRYVFHYYDTHGIPPELFSEIIAEPLLASARRVLYKEKDAKAKE